MEKATFGHRRQERQQQQQQPQQSAVNPARTKLADLQAGQDHPRNAWQQLAMAQARKQSGQL